MAQRERGKIISSVPSVDRLASIDAVCEPIYLLPSTMAGGVSGEFHTHRKAQLVYPKKGRFRIYTNKGMWTGSPQQAMWIPPLERHTVEAVDDLFVHNVYVGTDTIPRLPDQCKIIAVSPLFRELLEYALHFPDADIYAEEYERLLHVITDQIRLSVHISYTHLPLSEHPRLVPVIQGLMAEPGNEQSLEEWAQKACASSRTLARLFVQQTGLTFRQWRQQLRVIEAITLLGRKHSVMEVALDLGYTSPSAFAQMFHRHTGRHPSDFFPPL